MPKGRGRFQQKILAALRTASRPLDLRALIPGRGRSEKRRALRKLAAEGLVREVGPDIWIAKGPWRSLPKCPFCGKRHIHGDASKRGRGAHAQK